MVCDEQLCNTVHLLLLLLLLLCIRSVSTITMSSAEEKVIASLSLNGSRKQAVFPQTAQARDTENWGIWPPYPFCPTKRISFSSVPCGYPNARTPRNYYGRVHGRRPIRLKRLGRKERNEIKNPTLSCQNLCMYVLSKKVSLDSHVLEGGAEGGLTPHAGFCSLIMQTSMFFS